MEEETEKKYANLSLTLTRLERVARFRNFNLKLYFPCCSFRYHPINRYLSFS